MDWLGPRRLRAVLAAMKVRGMAIYGSSAGDDGGHATPTAGSGIEHRHRNLGGGGNLRAAVFGVSDGLVSNASLILGVSGANPDAHMVLLSGVAGLAAGAFAMAAGEYVSVHSQRELYEYQIALERDELKEYPEAEAQELALIYVAKGLPQREADKLAQRLVSDPEHALDTLAREELGLNPGEFGSPLGAARVRSARLRPARPCRSCPSSSPRAPRHFPSRSASRPSRCSAWARCCRSSPAAAHGCPACGRWRWARSPAA